MCIMGVISVRGIAMEDTFPVVRLTDLSLPVRINAEYRSQLLVITVPYPSIFALHIASHLLSASLSFPSASKL